MTRVLVISNTLDHVATLTSILTMYGSSAYGAHTFEKGLVLLEKHEPHLIIYEPLADRMQGWKFVYELLKYDPVQRPYLVAFAHNPSRRMKALNMECGADLYIKTPVTIATILEWVQTARQRAESSPIPW